MTNTEIGAIALACVPLLTFTIDWFIKRFYGEKLRKAKMNIFVHLLREDEFEALNALANNVEARETYGFRISAYFDWSHEVFVFYFTSITAIVSLIALTIAQPQPFFRIWAVVLTFWIFCCLVAITKEVQKKPTDKWRLVTNHWRRHFLHLAAAVTATGVIHGVLSAAPG